MYVCTTHVDRGVGDANISGFSNRKGCFVLQSRLGSMTVVHVHSLSADLILFPLAFVHP